MGIAGASPLPLPGAPTGVGNPLESIWSGQPLRNGGGNPFDLQGNTLNSSLQSDADRVKRKRSSSSSSSSEEAKRKRKEQKRKKKDLELKQKKRQQDLKPKQRLL